MRRVRFFQSADRVNGADIEHSIAIVADVLRATSTIVTALANGCKSVIPVAEIDEARQTAARMPRKEIILGGERKGRRIDGFDFGNSPQDYTAESVSGKIVITTTTNGTKALVHAGHAKKTLVLSFLNMTAVANYVLSCDDDIALVAAGIYGEFSLEDSVCCGVLLQQLVGASPGQFKLDENAEYALRLAQKHNGRIDEMLHDSPHGDFLRKINYASDLAVCARVDSQPIVPTFKDGRIEIIKRN